ncbi:hypothetical protein ACFQRB_20150 [Halobaculum litoreum]|uniref:Uncharacterized protein n=1 Tax=Halobaculum litoreum TaxID=3031998 RepID=A0ABD5XYJ2_9EURY
MGGVSVVNHVPDTVLDRVDAFGEGLLYGDPPDVVGELREDLRIRIRADDAATATCVYLTEHTRSPPTLRGRGSYVTTIVDGVDGRLREWGSRCRSRTRTSPPTTEPTGTRGHSASRDGVASPPGAVAPAVAAPPGGLTVVGHVSGACPSPPAGTTRTPRATSSTTSTGA